MASICPISRGLDGSGYSLLRVPSVQASTHEWEAAIPISELPGLPKRATGYYTEPWCGICIVGSLSFALAVATTALGLRSHLSSVISTLGVGLIWTWALVAVVCTAYILFGGAGEIKRSPSTCYPIPQEIANALLARRSLTNMCNVQGTDGASFCVRCLLWRPSNSHHCNTCQRCVTGFDHHCGVFGRCIVNGNMPCFITLNAMMLAGFVTLAVVANDQANRRGPISTDPYVPAAPPVVLPSNAQVIWGPPVYTTTLPPAASGLQPAVAQLREGRLLLDVTQASATSVNFFGV